MQEIIMNDITWKAKTFGLTPSPVLITRIKQYEERILKLEERLKRTLKLPPFSIGESILVGNEMLVVQGYESDLTITKALYRGKLYWLPRPVHLRSIAYGGVWDLYSNMWCSMACTTKYGAHITGHIASKWYSLCIGDLVIPREMNSELELKKFLKNVADILQVINLDSLASNRWPTEYSEMSDICGVDVKLTPQRLKEVL